MQDAWYNPVIQKAYHILSMLMVRKEKIWVSLLYRSSPLLFYAGILISFLNIILLLSFAVRLRRLDPVLVLFILVILYVLLFLTWKNSIDFIGKVQVFRKSLFMPDLLRTAIGSVIFGLCLVSLLGGLIWSILMGNPPVLLCGIIAAFLFYQWSSIMIYPENIEVEFKNVNVENQSLIFVDWLILKFLIFYLFCIELSIVAVCFTPLVLLVDLIRLWNATPSNVSLLYTVSLTHQGIWVGALIFPLVGYILLQGWVFLWEVLKRVWSKNNEKEESDEN